MTDKFFKELDAAAKRHSANRTYGGDINIAMEESFKAGAAWQKEFMESNRIKHCDGITEELFKLGTEFVDSFIAAHRIPTILDAIEYGMSIDNK